MSFKTSMPGFEGEAAGALEYMRQDKEKVLDLQIKAWIDDFMAYLEPKGFDSEEASAFILLAATLMEWKMQLLLPKPPEAAKEEEPYDRAAHLEEYRRIQTAAQQLSRLAEQREWWVARPADEVQIGIDPVDRLRHTGLFDLLTAFQRVLQTSDEMLDVDEVIEAEEYELEHQMTYILSRLQQNRGRILFEQLFRPGSRRNLLVATFLALLELVRLQQLKIEQTTSYGELWIGEVVSDAR
ncbi:MAG: segregation/condensation protein A [Negativicutes bacterium]|nr:segregation/condensation protein A [Negativicutes bacterium]